MIGLGLFFIFDSLTMLVQQESDLKHSITRYSDHSLWIDAVEYQDNIVVKQTSIYSPWMVSTIEDLSPDNGSPLLTPTPEIILIGHHTPNSRLSPVMLEYLYEKRIGIETMPIASAIRTFNILLSEGRDVVLGILWEDV